MHKAHKQVVSLFRMAPKKLVTFYYCENILLKELTFMKGTLENAKLEYCLHSSKRCEFLHKAVSAILLIALFPPPCDADLNETFGARINKYLSSFFKMASAKLVVFYYCEKIQLRELNFMKETLKSCKLEYCHHASKKCEFLHKSVSRMNSRNAF